MGETDIIPEHKRDSIGHGARKNVDVHVQGTLEGTCACNHDVKGGSRPFLKIRQHVDTAIVRECCQERVIDMEQFC